MNHQKIYNDIIINAIQQNRIKLRKNQTGYVYYENHHIIPKCLNGTNDKENLVLLTAREHYVCHKLLTYIYKNNRKIACAFHKMTFGNSNKCIKNSYDYKYARELISDVPFGKETLEKFKRRIPWNKNKQGVQKCSQAKRKKISEKTSGEKNPMYGKKGKLCPSYGLKRSPETKEKLRNKKIGENNPNAGFYEIVAPDKKIYHVKGATTFIKEYPEYNINRHFIYYVSKMNGKFYKNWKIKKLN